MYCDYWRLSPGPVNPAPTAQTEGKPVRTCCREVSGEPKTILVNSARRCGTRPSPSPHEPSSLTQASPLFQCLGPLRPPRRRHYYSSYPTRSVLSLSILHRVSDTAVVPRVTPAYERVEGNLEGRYTSATAFVRPAYWYIWRQTLQSLRMQRTDKLYRRDGPEDTPGLCRGRARGVSSGKLDHIQRAGWISRTQAKQDESSFRFVSHIQTEFLMQIHRQVTIEVIALLSI
jgi:hypothetical protein